MIRPANNKILTKVIPNPNFVDGLELPEGSKPPAQRAKVIAAGAGTQDEVMEAKAGDVVLYSQGAGSVIVIDNEEYLMLNIRDIIGFDE